MKIRPMREGDTNFILSTWLKSYYEEMKRNGSKGVVYPKDDVFFKGHQEAIKDTLKSAQVSICIAPDDENQIIGWAAFSGNCAHYVYVKHVFRQLGVAKALLKDHKLDTYSHHTRYARFINKGLIYNPYQF